MKCAVGIQTSLLALDWPEGLLEHAVAGRQYDAQSRLLWNGLRVRCANLGNLKIALRGGGGGGDMDARRRRGGGVGEMGFRVGPFVLCKNGCWCQRHRNTNFGLKKFFLPIISPPTFE